MFLVFFNTDFCLNSNYVPNYDLEISADLPSPKSRMLVNDVCHYTWFYVMLGLVCKASTPDSQTTFSLFDIPFILRHYSFSDAVFKILCDF